MINEFNKSINLSFYINGVGEGMREGIGISNKIRGCLISNISNMRRSVSSPDETPKRELKIRRAAEYF